MEDVDKSILYCTEAIFLPPISRDGYHLNNLFQLLFHLAFALIERSQKLEQPEGIKYSINYLRYLRGSPLDFFDVSRSLVTTSLIQALGIQVDLEARDGTQNIKEMVILFRELLASNPNADFPDTAFILLSTAINTEVTRGRVQSLAEVTECLRDAVKTSPPGSHIVWLVLAFTLSFRFKNSHSNEDCEEVMALVDKILDPNQPVACPDSIRVEATQLSASVAFYRSTVFQNPEYSEVAISRLRSLLNSPFIDEQLRLEITHQLAMQSRERFRQYGLLEGSEEADYCYSQLVDTSSSRSLEEFDDIFPLSGVVLESYPMTRMAEKIQHLEELLLITPPRTKRHEECLTHLANWYGAKFSRTNNVSDIEEAIKYGRLSIDATYSNGERRDVPLIYLRDILHLAFEKTGEISYLEALIAVDYDLLESSERFIHFHVVQKLVLSLIFRAGLLGRREDYYEAIRLMSTVTDNQYARETDRFLLSCLWALVARNIRHPTTLTAYKNAMSLLQESMSFAPTVSVQHAGLVAMGEAYQRLPLDYASFQIQLGRFEEAVETLEQGRALLWSEMRGLRSSVSKFIEGDSPVAKRLAKINEELEELTISDTPSGRPDGMGDGTSQVRDGTDPFGRLVVKQRKLLEERDSLISQIQSRPSSEGFLNASSFTTLCSAASRGPVIIINHCRYRSDILILFPNALPCSIPTANNFYLRANQLQDDLFKARKHGLDSCEYQDALCSVLKVLYELVGEPVIKRFRLLGVPEQSRIWWCPTSVFCSLPLHAMGPIPSGGTRERYFSDLYISSYTPSLSALIESRQKPLKMLGRPSLLLVAQPDDDLLGVNGEIKVIRRALKTQVTETSLISGEATPSSVLEGLRGCQFAHFACHGMLEAGKPFEASFKLHGGSRLTLLDIVQSRLPDAELAFLSCCHAAEITEESIADEALHLTAAMQYCGFRSVVGTMWEMADTDGRDMAKSFYRSLYSNKQEAMPFYERSAGALRIATQKLREKRGVNLERWVNFVHYGA